MAYTGADLRRKLEGGCSGVDSAPAFDREFLNYCSALANDTSQSRRVSYI